MNHPLRAKSKIGAVIVSLSAGCSLDFNMFLTRSADGGGGADGIGVDGGGPNTPFPLCTEAPAGSTAHVRVVNVSGGAIQVCAGAVDLTPIAGGGGLTNAYATGAPVDLASAGRVRFGVRSAGSPRQSCMVTSGLTDTPMYDLVSGATYTFVVATDGTNPIFRIARDATCVVAESLVRLLNALPNETLDAAAYERTGPPPSWDWQNFAPAENGIARADRGYVSLRPSSAANVWLHSLGDNSTYQSNSTTTYRAMQRRTWVVARDLRTSTNVSIFACYDDPTASDQLRACESMSTFRP